MRAWESASVIFFLYVAAAAALPGRPRPPAILQLYAGVAAGVLFVYGVSQLSYYAPLHDWVAPPVALLLGYWVSGLLFAAPEPAQERALMALDRRLRIL